jgi:hypothetical protein
VILRERMNGRLCDLFRDWAKMETKSGSPFIVSSKAVNAAVIALSVCKSSGLKMIKTLESSMIATRQSQVLI